MVFRGLLIIIGLIILIPIALVLMMIDTKPPVEAYRTEESRDLPPMKYLQVQWNIFRRPSK